MGGRKREVDRGVAQSNRVTVQGVGHSPRDLRAMARAIIALTLWKNEKHRSPDKPEK